MVSHVSEAPAMGVCLTQDGAQSVPAKQARQLELPLQYPRMCRRRPFAHLQTVTSPLASISMAPKPLFTSTHEVSVPIAAYYYDSTYR